MSDAEVMTTAIVAALYYGGNIQRARKHLKAEGYIPKMLSKSRLNRRLHRIHDFLSPPAIIIAFLAPDVTKVKNGEAIRPAKGDISMA